MKCKTNSIRFNLVVILALFLALPCMANASDFQSNGRVGKAFFDIGNSDMTLEVFTQVLGGVQITHMQLEAEGVTPDFILAIRGMNLSWITEDADYTVRTMITDLNDMGVKIQTCSNMLHMLGIDPATLLPEIEVVQNNWVSAIFHQNEGRGYAYITF